MAVPPFLLERFFAEHEFTVRHLMCASDPETITARELLALDDGALERLLSLRLGYGEARGSAALRTAIAAMYQATGADDVVVHTGAQEPILTFALAALGPGDHAVVHTPCYQSLVEAMRLAGATTTSWVAREQDAWQLDPDDLPRLFTAATKAVVVNLPHNPTGALLQRDRWQRLVEVCAQRGVWLLSDEAYRGLELDPAAQLPAACDLYPRAASTGALAKGFGLGGLRIGWLASRSRELLAKVEAVKDYTSICNPTPSELLAEIAVRHRARFFAAARERIARNAASFSAWLSARGMSWVAPRGGTMGLFRVDGEPASAFARRMLEERGVLFAPGPLFLFDDTHCRVGLGRATFDDGLAALQA